MEDAHIAIADLKNYVNNEAVDSSISIFGVFDGHGGVDQIKSTISSTCKSFLFRKRGCKVREDEVPRDLGEFGIF
jgi:hypothetical protein